MHSKKLRLLFAHEHSSTVWTRTPPQQSEDASGVMLDEYALFFVGAVLFGGGGEKKIRGVESENERDS